MNPNQENGKQNDATVRLGAFGKLGECELSWLSRLVGEEKVLAKGQVLWDEGVRLPCLFLLLTGWMGSRRVDGDGDSQLVRLHAPGDLLGLPSLAFKEAGETIIALSGAKLRPLRLPSLGAVFEAQPRIAAMLFMVSQQERMELSDRLFATRFRNGEALTAFNVLALLRRLLPENDGSSPDGVRLPIGTADLAELFGMTRARLAAGLKRLGQRGLVSWDRRRLTALDWAGLTEAANLPDRTLVSDPYWMPSAN